MDDDQRKERTDQTLTGYAHGPGAPVRATWHALQSVETSNAVILVEGISDQIAVETLAARLGRDLPSEGVAVLPVGGAQAMARYVSRFGPLGDGLRMAGLCDADATDVIIRALARAGMGRSRSEVDLALIGFHVCRNDLEDELIRAVGPDTVQQVLEAEDELRSFRTFQKQPEWRNRPVERQLHRFLGSKARRSLRYARLLIEAMNIEEVPEPLRRVVDDA